LPPTPVPTAGAPALTALAAAMAALAFKRLR
jgi:IPTL-CTERM motif